MPTGYEDVKKIIKVGTNVTKSCPHCSKSLDMEYFDQTVNHLIQDHKYKLLHVGSEWSEDWNGNSCHHTVAVLGI